MNIKERLKSIPLWASVLCLIGLIAKRWIGFDIPGWADISTEILFLLGILFGTANNPTDRHNF